MGHRLKQFKLTLLASLCCLLWGTAIPTLKTMYRLMAIAADDVFSKLTLAGLRFLLAGVLIFLYLMIKDGRLEKVAKPLWHKVLIFGLLNTTMQYLFFYVGVGNTGAIKGVLIDTSKPLMVVVLAHFFTRDDPMSYKKLIGLFIGFVGVLVANVEAIGVGGLTFSMTLMGEGALIVSSIAYSVAVVYGKHLLKAIGSATLNMYQMMIGAMILLLSGILLSGGFYLRFDGWSLVLLVYSAILSAVAFVIWYHLIDTYSPSGVTVHAFLVPVFGSMISAVLFVEEHFSYTLILSLLLMAMGIVMVNKRGTEGS